MSVHPESSFSTTVLSLRRAGCVFAEDEARLLHEAAASPAVLASLVARRAAGLPLEHVLGWAEFGGRRYAVDTGVFVPRRRTEFLVAQAAALAPPRAVVVDLCCGSGALGAALAAASDTAELHACDVEPAAVRCARRNVGELGHVYEGDLFHPLPDALRGRSTSSSPTSPTSPPATSRCCPPRPASTNRASPWTEAATGSTSCAGSPPRHRPGSRTAAACSWRRASGSGTRRPGSCAPPG